MATFFATAADFRAWLRQHSTSAAELAVGFHKVGSGKPSISWKESVDEALCVGWIDGVRKRIDDGRYQIRFTPRKPGSTWSAINIERAKALAGEGRMTDAGLAAFARRIEGKSPTYSYEQGAGASLDPAAEACFRKHKRAWAFFEAQPPSYRRTTIWWVVSARREETRRNRLARLIAASGDGRRL